MKRWGKRRRTKSEKKGKKKDRKDVGICQRTEKEKWEEERRG